MIFKAGFAVLWILHGGWSGRRVVGQGAASRWGGRAYRKCVTVDKRKKLTVVEYVAYYFYSKRNQFLVLF